MNMIFMTDKDPIIRFDEQSLTPEQKSQVRLNIDAVSAEDVEALINGENLNDFSETGDLVELNVDADIALEVISKIHRDETWEESNKLVLHQVSGTNFIDMSSFLGGAGTVIEKNGLTATVNADSTVTISGTNESDGYINIINKYHWNGELSARVYPAGTYTIPNGFTMAVRKAKYPDNESIPGIANLNRKVTISEPFRVIMLQYGVSAGNAIDVTLPLGIFRGESIPETEFGYSGALHTVTFDTAVHEGEFNWRTGELKDASGNTVAYYNVPEIKSFPGTNYFWTGFGENTVSNAPSDLSKVILRLNEPAPEETIPSVCDFMLTPATPEAAYALYYNHFLPGNNGQFAGNDVPILTTKGTLSIKNVDGKIKYSKYIKPIFNTRGVADTLTHNGLEKRWSDKFYLTKAPTSITESPPSYQGPPQAYIFVWEFDESEFVNTGIPAKIRDIPMASPCFINNDKSENNVNTLDLWNGDPYPAFFSYNAETGKYILTARGLQAWCIQEQLTHYSKVHFYYQLEHSYTLPFTFAMGIEAGDYIEFNPDLVDNQPYIDVLGDFQGHSVIPSVTAFVPRNVEDAMDGMSNMATMLNMSENGSGGDATVQGYSWIGAGDGVTDYAVQIQSKLDELHNVSDGGTIYLGPGTYPINDSLIVYDNTRIIGDGQTVIEQRADNTHAIIINGSNITIKDLSINLMGGCTAITACVYVNSDNKPDSGKYDSTLPQNTYATNITIDNVSMSGEYKFSSENGYPVVSDVYEKYMGVGIYATKMYFNYAHIEDVLFTHLMACIYGGGGSNYFNISAQFCKYGLYIIHGGDNTYFVNGHSHYAIDGEGEHITMSDTIAHVESDNMSTYHLRVFDVQAFRRLAYFGPKTDANKIDVQCIGALETSHEWNILKWFIEDYGRRNVVCNLFKTPVFQIGSQIISITEGYETKLSDPVIQNALSGAGIWGNISSNTEFDNYGIELRDVCRYPSDKAIDNRLPYILSTRSPSTENPIEIVIDYSDRPVIGIPNYFIQFCHKYVASDYMISFDTTNTGEYNFEIPVTDNVSVAVFSNEPQIGEQYITYRMKIKFTKPLQIPDLERSVGSGTFDYNPNGFVGICNIGMTVNDYAGRSFLGECGGSLYGNVDMHQNTLKNLPDPVDDGDAVSKSYLESYISEAILGGAW